MDAAATDGAVPTYADGSTGETESSRSGDSQSRGEATAGAQRPPGPGDVVVTYWHWSSEAGAVEAAGFVDGLSEDGGTCTLTLTKGGTVLSGAGSAVSDATTTSCGTLSVPVPAPARNGGDWEAVLAYESSAGRTSSEPFTVTVP